MEKGLQKRIDERLKKYSGNKNYSIKVGIFQSEHYIDWLGGSVFSSRDSFHHLVRKRYDYFEKGSFCCKSFSYFDY